MKLLNLGAGNNRILNPDWINLDNLYSQHATGSPERNQLYMEPNYVDHDLLQPLPFEDGHFDGVLASHVFEHFDAQQCLRIMRECRRVTKSGGCLVASVPNASYFRDVHPEDRNENWERLFGQADPANPIPTFMEAALFFDQHMQLFTEDALWCLLIQCGYKTAFKPPHFPAEIEPYMNRRIFSLEMLGIK